MKRVAFAILCCLVACAMGAHAQDGRQEEVRELGATIKGNQEQPKVLYIVPWKSAQGEAAIPYRAVTGQTNKLFRHIDRNEHVRHLEFLDALENAR